MNGMNRMNRMNRINRINRMNRMSDMGGESKIYRITERKGATDGGSEAELPLVHESCNYSGFSFAAVAGALLMFAGIIIYALVA